MTRSARALAGTALIALLAGLLAVAVPAEPSSAGEPERSVAASPDPSDLARFAPGRRDMMRTIRAMSSMGARKTGTPAGRRAAEYVAQRFRDAGLDKVWIEKSTSYSWRAEDAALRAGGRRIDAHPISFSMIKGPRGTGTLSTGPRGLRAKVVDVGSGGIGDRDVRGKIVLFDLKFQLPLAALVPFIEFIHDPEREILDVETLFSANPYVTSLSTMIKQAQAGGAVGMIGVLVDYFDSNKYHNEYYRRTPMTIPGMWVTRDEGARLRRLLADDPTVRMRLTTHRRKVVARTPIGILRGRSKDTVMVQSHHDSMGPGAVEDASGTAEVIALAEYYGALADRPGAARRDKTLMFTTFDTHFTGYHAHMAFVDKYVKRRATPYRIVANDTIEHIAKKGVVGKDGRLVILDESEPRGIFENLSLPLKLTLMQSIRRRGLDATVLLNGAVFRSLGIPTDASFVLAAGVPTVSLIAGPLYMYDDADTPRAVDQEQLRPVLLANIDLLDAIDGTPSNQIGLLTPLGL